MHGEQTLAHRHIMARSITRAVATLLPARRSRPGYRTNEIRIKRRKNAKCPCPFTTLQYPPSRAA